MTIQKREFLDEGVSDLTDVLKASLYVDRDAAHPTTMHFEIASSGGDAEANRAYVARFMETFRKYMAIEKSIHLKPSNAMPGILASEEVDVNDRPLDQLAMSFKEGINRVRLAMRGLKPVQSNAWDVGG